MKCNLRDFEKLAEFRSIWDDGETEICCPCIVNMQTREIVEIDFHNRKVYSANSDITASNVDDLVELLDREEVVIDEESYLAFIKEELDSEESEIVFWYE